MHMIACSLLDGDKGRFTIDLSFLDDLVIIADLELET